LDTAPCAGGEGPTPEGGADGKVRGKKNSERSKMGLSKKAGVQEPENAGNKLRVPKNKGGGSGVGFSELILQEKIGGKGGRGKKSNKATGCSKRC